MGNSSLNNGRPSIGVAVITHCAAKHMPHCLPPLVGSPLSPRVLVVNSSSGDGTVEAAQELGAETLIIPRPDFNHGTTREKARQHLGTDIVVMITPDAYCLDSEMLEKLTAPITSGEASVSYARQIAHDGADFFEAFHREYNYPPNRHIRGIEDVGQYGVYTFFCSNSCAAYSNPALDEIGGFQPVLLGEDTVAVARLLHKGHKIAYAAEAVVKHSHRYTLQQEFRRHFDTGLARHHYQDLLAPGGRDAKRGKDYVKALVSKLIREKPLLLPYAAAQTATKWLGYRLGALCPKAPLWVKKACTSQDFYWNSNAFKEYSASSRQS